MQRTKIKNDGHKISGKDTFLLKIIIFRWFYGQEIHGI